ncbi:UDP-N-acetylglucosamine 1-carboxyvinyltransferase [Candidatus Aerophobetes bacterium]|nr:UDP-N-acetylglucosamine 1-carboxyvinyltransferase [Candidatus Aerophobetes bacterium]
MGKFVIEGGIPLEGTVKVSGSKNAALPIMAACLLTEGECHLKNIPHLADIQVMGKTLKELGVKVERKGEKLSVNAGHLTRYEASYELVRKMRASFLILGPLLARLSRARVPLPGGCNIGRRPIDLHLKGLNQMGAKIEIRHGYVEATARKGLQGTNIYFDFPSVGATENIILAGCLAKGTTIIENPSRTPEVLDMINFLKEMGVKINEKKANLIKIEGRGEILPANYSIIPDRIEAGTLLIAGVISKGKIIVEGGNPNHLGTFLVKLKEMGVKIEISDKAIRATRESNINPVRVKTLSYPGFSTDLQPQLSSLACLAKGKSIIEETIFENRFTHVPELRRMGAQIEEGNSRIIIEGVPSLSGTQVTAPDIRGGAALVLAGLAARGRSEVFEIHHIDRGYERLEEKLSNLGARIRRKED